ncbi:MAG TPA: ABC transporter ATP-binding protein, partial [Stellaceae bacterium]|nr:ABC transporter ATP-binding protein [Stellaceae bacterium]
MSAEPIIEAEGLTRHYGDRVAVDHVNFSIARGEIFGFLGPNGAGKSTTVRMLTGYIQPTSGTARVAGYDIVAAPVSARQHIGVVPEEASAYADLTVWQNVMLMAELHSVPRRRRIERGAELIELFGLADRREQKGRDLSKGLRQRLMLCMALVSDPEILFLDEPTSGLDVASS